MNHFSYPLTIVQINIFVEPQNIFPNQTPKPQTIEPAPPPRIFNYRVPPGLFLQLCHIPHCFIIQLKILVEFLSAFCVQKVYG